MRFTRTPLLLLVPVLALAAGAASAPAQTQVVRMQTATVEVDAAAVTGLETRLRALAAGLPADQRRILDSLLLRAAAAPADDPEGTPVRPTFFAPPSREALLRSGGRRIVEGGPPATGREGAVAIRPKPEDPNAPRPGNGAVAIGPKQDDPRSPRTGAVAIGPKQDDPVAPRPTRVLAIGPKQDDPRTPQGALRTRLTELSASLEMPERAVLDWMLHRAAGSHGTPGGLPPGRTPSLAQALGITPLAIGPKQDDPAPPPPPNTRWVLKLEF